LNVLVLGAGVVGVTSAYALMCAGHKVVVVDRQNGPGLETSFANGGQISVSHAEPWANPAAWGQLLRWLGRENAPLLIRMRLDPGLWSWGLKFFANCTPARTRINSERILRIGLYSRRCLDAVAAETNIQFDRKKGGILQFYRSRSDFNRAHDMATVIAQAGCNCEILDVEACVALEPALADASQQIAGGLYTPDDESGDAHKFTAGLAEVCAAGGVEFQYGVSIKRLRTDSKRITAVVTDGGELIADTYVVALGSYSPLLVRPFGIKLPIYPVKGYSVTLPLGPAVVAPTISLIDVTSKIVYSRLGENLRIAGTGEFAGYDASLTESRSQAIFGSARTIFPRLGQGDGARFWAGLRPSTPDGVPVIGATAFENLYLNTGHGTLGWTLSCGSAQLTADIISGRTPGINVDDIGINRFR
jgi:D-amino-acid dehydrogenase